MYNINRDDSDEFFATLWSKSRPKFIENTVIRTGKAKTSISINQLKQIGNNNYYSGLFNEISATHMRWTNLFYTPNSFRPCGNRNGCNRKNNLFSVYCFAIDVDFIDNKRINDSMLQILRENSYQGYRCIVSYCVKPCDYYRYMEGQFEYIKVPRPNYIECGHRLRMIYLLESPINALYGKKAIRAIEQLQTVICERLNNEFDCGAEKQQINGYFRMPNSINSSDGSIVKIWKISDEKYMIDDLIYEYLPDLKYSYEEYQEIKLKKRKSTYWNYNDKEELCNKRLSAFESLQDYAVENHRREILTYLYVATCLSIHPDYSPIDIALKFNMGFSIPLSDGEIRSSFRNTKSAKFKNSTIANMLGLNPEQLSEHDLTQNKREKERIERISRGDTRWQKAEERYQTYKRLQESGLKRSDIAEQMNVSIETIKKYRKRLTKEKQQAKGRTT